MFKRVLVLILFLNSFQLFGCDWCSKPHVFELSEEQLQHNPLAGQNVKNVQQELITDKKVIKLQEDASDFVYFKRYLGNYYPDAQLMCKSLFVDMCPTALFAALEELAILADKTLWLYFLNDKKGFDARYLCKIIGEYSRINRFIDQAFYNSKTQKIIEVDSKKGLGVDLRSLQRVTAFWAKNKKSAPYEFYAVFYDYVTVGFNSSVMSSLQTKDFTAFNEYYPLMDQLVHKLSSSSYEKYYQDAFKKSKRIFTLVQNRWEEQNKRTKPVEAQHHG